MQELTEEQEPIEERTHPADIHKTPNVLLERIADQLRRLGAPRIASPETELLEDHQIPPSTFYAEKAAGRGPRVFKIGRRNYILHRDWESWLTERAEQAKNA